MDGDYPELKEAVAARADADETSASEIIREALPDGMEHTDAMSEAEHASSLVHQG